MPQIEMNETARMNTEFSNPTELEHAIQSQERVKALVLELAPIVAQQGFAFNGPLRISTDEIGVNLTFRLTLPSKE